MNFPKGTWFFYIAGTYFAMIDYWALWTVFICVLKAAISVKILACVNMLQIKLGFAKYLPLTHSTTSPPPTGIFYITFYLPIIRPIPISVASICSDFLSPTQGRAMSIVRMQIPSSQIMLKSNTVTTHNRLARFAHRSCPLSFLNSPDALVSVMLPDWGDSLLSRAHPKVNVLRI